jgi:hypothetical protein
MFTDRQLEAFLDDALPAQEMARIEDAARRSDELRRRLAAIRAQQNAGMHSLGALWQRHRLTCPSRTQLGSYLLRTLPPSWQEYIEFHIHVVGCRMCQANLSDLQQQEQGDDAGTPRRRQRYFQSSVGLLPKSRRD